jgi:hypothetical protein
MESWRQHRDQQCPWIETHFAKRFLAFVENRRKRYGSFDHDGLAELERYKVCYIHIHLISSVSIAEFSRTMLVEWNPWWRTPYLKFTRLSGLENGYW